MRQERPDDQGQPKLLEGAFDGRGVMDQVDVRAGWLGLPAHDEARLAADRRPRIGELTAGDLAGQVGRQRVEHGLRLAEGIVRDGRALLPEVDDGLDAPPLERLQQEAVGDVVRSRLGREAGIGDRHGQVVPSLGRGRVEELLMERPVHEDVGPDTQQDRRQRDERDEGDRQASPDAMHQVRRLSGRPCSRRPGR